MHIQFAELPVQDPERAKAFYIGCLGCTVVADSPMGEHGGRWVELALPGAQTRLHFKERTGGPADIPVLVLVTDDVAATVAQLQAR